MLTWYRGRVWLSGGFLPLTQTEERMWEMHETFLKRRETAKDKGRSAAVQLDETDAQLFPALVEFLTVDVWPDGTERRTGTVLLFLDQGRIKACLADRDQDVVLFTTVDALGTALEAVEDALRDPKGDWRPSKKDRARR